MSHEGIEAVRWVYRHLPIHARRFIDRWRNVGTPKRGRRPGGVAETLDPGEGLEMKVIRKEE